MHGDQCIYWHRTVRTSQESTCVVDVLTVEDDLKKQVGDALPWRMMAVSGWLLGRHSGSTVISLSTQYEREPLYFHISNVSHWHGLIATHCTDVVPPAAYASLRDRSLMLRVQVMLFTQCCFNAGQLFRSLGHFQQFRRCLIKSAAIHTQRRSQNLVKPAPPL